jgi:hypothetical protein
MMKSNEKFSVFSNRFPRITPQSCSSYPVFKSVILIASQIEIHVVARDSADVDPNVFIQPMYCGLAQIFPEMDHFGSLAYKGM